MKSAIKTLYACNLLETQEDIDKFETTLQTITLSNDATSIKGLCLVLDDNTNQHEVMFNVIHSIEYLYTNKESEGLYHLVLSIPKMVENAEEWLEVIHYRILNTTKTRLAYTEVLKTVPSSIKNLVVKRLEDIKNEDEETFGAKVSEVLTGI